MCVIVARPGKLPTDHVISDRDIIRDGADLLTSLWLQDEPSNWHEYVTVHDAAILKRWQGKKIPVNIVRHCTRSP